jgi:hypothetical protein
MLKKIISGGQIGADQGALDAAIKYSFPYGGWIQKGRKIQSGILPDKYKLKEMTVAGFKEKIEQNVIDSDGTVIISHGDFSGGADYSQKMAEKHNRPCLHIDLEKTPPFIASPEINTWIIDHNIEVLNVTGSKASEDSNVHRDTFYIIEGTILLSLVNAKSGESLTDYDRKVLLDKLPIAPRTVDEAVVRMLSDLDLKTKTKISHMKQHELFSLQSELRGYFKDAFGVWHGNSELLTDCRAKSGEAIRDEGEATFVILKTLWEKLRKSNTLRVVK